MKCNHCGAEIPDDSLFCEQCGKKVEAANKPKKLNKKLVIGIAAAAVAVAAVLAVLLWPKQDNEPEEEVAVSDNPNRYPIFDENGKCGFIDSTGNVAIPPQYDELGLFSEGLAHVTVNGAKGFIDTTGNLIIEPHFSWAAGFYEGLAAVQLSPDGKIGYINKRGEMVIPTQFDYASYFSDGLALIGKIEEFGMVYGYINKSGETVIAPQYSYAGIFNEGLAAVYVDGKCGFIDSTGKMVVPPQYSVASDFHEGLAAVKAASDDGKYGYIDKTGNLVISYQYDGALPFSEGLAAVVINGKWGFIDSTGKLIINPQYDNVWPSFTNGITIARYDDYVGIIDKTGKRIKFIECNEDKMYGNTIGFQIYNGMPCIAWVEDGYYQNVYLNKSGKVVYEWQVKPKY